MKDGIVERIATGGPLPFDEYMSMCLYDPDGGYFSAGHVRSGERSDFVTSPEVSEWFGSLLGTWAAENRPSPDAVLVEIGSGSGSLLSPAVISWADDGSSVYAVEISPSARDAISSQVPAAIIVGSVDDVPKGLDAVVIVNEVLDNMPAALVRRSSGCWVEIGVAATGGELALVELLARDAVADWCDAVFGTVPEDTIVTAQLAAGIWIESVISHFGRVTMCMIDYADSAASLAQRSAGEIVRSFREHRTSIDWLSGPGSCDITVDVNIDGIERSVARSGAELMMSSQREFLVEGGVVELLDQMVAEERSFASSGRIMDQLAVRSERINTEALLDPNGLGGFTVFVVTSSK